MTWDRLWTHIYIFDLFLVINTAIFSLNHHYCGSYCNSCFFFRLFVIVYLIANAILFIVSTIILIGKHFCISITPSIITQHNFNWKSRAIQKCYLNQFSSKFHCCLSFHCTFIELSDPNAKSKRVSQQIVYFDRSKI